MAFPKRSRLLKAMVLLVVGCLLFLYWRFQQALPGGLQEFAYQDRILEPMPFAAMRGFTYQQLSGHVGRLFLLGPALLGLAWLLASVVPGHRSARGRSGERNPFPGLSPSRLAAAAVALSSLCTAWVLLGILQGRAIFDDDLTYAMQAGYYAHGMITDSSFLAVPAWKEHFTIWTPTGPSGKYLFGEPLVQVPGLYLGIPALAHLFMIPLMGLAWYHAVRRGTGSSSVAAWAVVLVLLSPMLMLTTATGLSHTTALTCLVLAGLGSAWALQERPWAGAALAGLSLGFGLTVRPQTLVPVGGVLGLVLLSRLLRRRHLGPALLLCACTGLWLLAIGWYDHRLSGSWSTLPWFLTDLTERYGFGDVFGDGTWYHSPYKALENLAVSLLRFNGWWLGWPLSLLPLLTWLLMGRPGRGWAVWVAAGVALLLFNAAYYSTGVSDTGPVYYYELLLPASLLGALALDAALKRWRAFTVAFLAVSALGGTGSFLAEQLSRLQRLVGYLHAPAQAVLSRLEPPALLLVESMPSESRFVGWVPSRFPYRYRLDSDPVVTFPRSDPDYVAALLKRYPHRNCYYTRWVMESPTRQVPELRPCDAAWDLLSRPPGLEQKLVSVPSTAQLLHLREPGWQRELLRSWVR